MPAEERRASIVSAACKLFAEKGFRGTTTRELAAAVGVTEPVLYEHFRTKRELYSAIIESKARQGMESLSALTEQHARLNDDLGFFRELGMTIVDWYTADPDFIRLLLFSNLEGHELKELFHERSLCCFHLVTDYLARRIADGAIRNVDPQLAARAYFGMVAHYAMTGLIFGFSPFNRPAGEVVAEMADIFMSGMCKDHAG